jgi:hypothetical protein
MEPVPFFLNKDLKKKEIITELKNRGLKYSFPNRCSLDNFIDDLKWPFAMTWRPEQLTVIKSFFSHPDEDIVIQAIFGGGKTTMMLAIIFILCLDNINMREKIFICAYNIGIKNELKKKTRKLGKIRVQTYDSLIYQLCKDLNYQDLKLLNFEAKRRFVRENIIELIPNHDIKYVFIDESQDLEVHCYKILKTYFPQAKFMFVGDIFQSIQKEPRDSLLWWLLSDKKSALIYKMLDTPRVPSVILDEIKDALEIYYPEFKNTIHDWHSSSIYKKDQVIQWKSFDSYFKVYKEILELIKVFDPKDVMILTFSSAITVRGGLGDVARIRKFMRNNNVSINPNHKRMLDDRLFITTSNSSKGLERKHVICMLTFPLELAFANFSNDLVMNLITVALSRCKESIIFYVPNYMERFSKVLNCFKRGPKPMIESKKKQVKINSDKECNTFDYDPTNADEMMNKEHSVTEIIRQNILSFETRQVLLRYAYNKQNVELPNAVINDVKSEEECSFVGLMFESLVLSTWTGKLPEVGFENMNHHGLFADYVAKINKCCKAYNKFKARYSPIASEKIRFQGSILYAQLHLFASQKIWIHEDANPSLYHHWIKIKPVIDSIRIHDMIKTQTNIKMPFLNGIMDASSSDDIFEIKASRSSDWKTNALLQSIIYGVMNGKSKFNIYLINVFSRHVKYFTVFLKKDLMWLRNLLIQDIVNWNINCFWAKNINFQIRGQEINLRESIFIDGILNILENKWVEFSICEFESITKTRMTVLSEKTNENTLLNDFYNTIQKYKTKFNIKYIYCFRKLNLDLQMIQILDLACKKYEKSCQYIGYGLCSIVHDFEFKY